MDDLVGWLGQAVGAVTVLLAVLDVVAIALLVAVVVRRHRGLFGGLSWSALPGASIGVLAGCTAVAAGIAVVFDVPVPLSWLTVSALVLVLVVRLRDERFWRGLAALTLIATVVGALVMMTTDVTVERDDGAAFYGVVRMTGIGGPNLNPEIPAWWIPLCATAFLSFGLPTALSITLSWLVATRAELSRLERVALVLVMARFVAMVFEAPLWTVAYLAGGAFLGIPTWRVAVGIVPAIAVCLVVGAGGVGGLLTGGRATFGLVPVVKAAADGVSAAKAFFQALATKPGARTLDDMRLARYVGQTARRAAPGFLSRGLIVLTLFVLLAWSAIASPPGPARIIHAERVTDEIALPVAAEAAYRGAGHDVWLRQSDDEVVRVDLTTGAIIPSGVDISGLAVVDGRVLALVPGTPSRVVELTANRHREVVRLPDGTAGLLAVDDDAVYVGGADGRLTRFDRATGTPTAQVDTGAPLAGLMAGAGAVWTLHTVTEPTPADGRYRGARRDPSTLEPAGEQPPSALLNDLAITGDGHGWIVLGTIAGPYPTSAERAAERPAGAGDLPDGGRVLPGAEGTAWVTLPLGRVEHLTPAGASRHDFHYDDVHSVLETDDGTWLLVSRRDRLLGAVSDPARSFLVRWHR